MVRRFSFLALIVLPYWVAYPLVPSLLRGIGIRRRASHPAHQGLFFMSSEDLIYKLKIKFQYYFEEYLKYKIP